MTDDCNVIHVPTADELCRQTVLQPQMALLFHHEVAAGGYISHGRDDARTVLTVHEIRRNEPGGTQLAPGRALSARDHQAVLQALESGAARHNQGGFLPESVVALDAESVTWWVPEGRRPMPYGERTLDVVWPPLVLHAVRGALAVAALGENARPGPQTMLYHAPLANTFTGGRICSGTHPLPEHLDPQRLAEWEAVLFESHFNEPHNPSALPDTGARTLCEYWAARSEDGAATTADVMTTMSMTLADWRRQLLEISR